MDMADLTNAPREVTLRGRAYRVAALEMADWGELTRYLKQHGASPLAALRSDELARLDPAHRRELYGVALAEARAWPPTVGTRAWFDALSDAPGGSAQFVWVCLKRLQPGVTLDEAARLAENPDDEENQALVFAALGLDVPPKSPAPTRGARPKLPRNRTNGRKSSTR